MKKSFLILTLALVFSGCNYEIKGDLNVNQKITLDSKDGDSTYMPGQYDAAVELSRTMISKRYKIKLNIQNRDKKNTHIFKAPKGANIPENGSIDFSAQDLKEKYGIHGDIRTNYLDDNRTIRDWERCTYQAPYTVCRTDQYGRTRCHTEYREQWGHREVEYFMRTKEQELDINLMDKNSAVANFRGQYRDTYPVYLYRGICR